MPVAVCSLGSDVTFSYGFVNGTAGLGASVLAIPEFAVAEKRSEFNKAASDFLGVQVP